MMPGIVICLFQRTDNLPDLVFCLDGVGQSYESAAIVKFELLCNDKEIFCNFGDRKISLRKYDSKISCFPSGDKGFRPCI